LHPFVNFHYPRLGGNQREIDRERARKRAEKAGAAKKNSEGNDGQLLKNKQEAYEGVARDAVVMFSTR